MRIESDVKLDYCDVLISPKWSDLKSRNDTTLDLQRTITMPQSKETWKGVPIIAANMDHTGTIAMANALKSFSCMTALHKFHSIDDLQSLAINSISQVCNNVWLTIGASKEQLQNLIQIYEFWVSHAFYKNLFLPKICVDVANGHTEDFRKFITKVREKFPRSTIMAGNVASPSVTQALILAGADVVKVGLGSGSACITRKMTGVGYPQLSAVIECADAAHGMKAHICADGGCIVPGDICKAFAAGADFVMLGSMLAGHDECNGERMIKYTEKIDCDVSGLEYATVNEEITGIKFRGMSSKEAQIDHYGSLKDYRAAEGKEVIVPYKGNVSNTMQEILGGLRSCMTYIGAKSLRDIPKCATFIRVNRQLNESLSK